LQGPIRDHPAGTILQELSYKGSSSKDDPEGGIAVSLPLSSPAAEPQPASAEWTISRTAARARLFRLLAVQAVGPSCATSQIQRLLVRVRLFRLSVVQAVGPSCLTGQIQRLLVWVRLFRLSVVQAVGLNCATGQILLRDKYRRGCAEFHTSPFSTAFPPDDHKVPRQPATLQRRRGAGFALPFRQTITRFPGSQRRFSVVEGQGSHCPFRQTTTRFPGSQRRFSVVEGQGSHCLSARRQQGSRAASDASAS
jgi:hypothetical protein